MIAAPHCFESADSTPVAAARPLVIVDADEVLLAFAGGFSRFLDARGLRLDLTSYRLHGNVRRKDDETALLDVEVSALLDEFRTELDWLESIDGAAETLAGLASQAGIVVLSNITPAQGPARMRNLSALSLSYPLLVNAGPKGAAVRSLARRAGQPVFFVDDIPQHHASVAAAAPEVLRIHFIGDDRLKPLLPPSEHAHFRLDSWAEIGALIRAKIAESGV